jgi:hypothetical protein
MTQRFIDDHKQREDVSNVHPKEMAAFDQALIGDTFRV